MALFSFGKKPDGQPAAAMPSVPTDKVIAMRQQGITNNQIIQTLQTQGYEPNAIFEALNQADLKGSIEMVTPPELPSDVPSNTMQFNAGFESEPGFGSGELHPMQTHPEPSSPKQMSAAQPDMGMEQYGGGYQRPPGLDRIEEIAEAIIDEKWNEIVRSINKIIEWKDRTEAKINQLDQRFNDLKTEYDNLNKGILGKIGEYDKNIVNIGVEIQAMEKVFEKVLPTFTENVHTLDRVSKDMQAALQKK
jgi:prefoldin subunit 5